MSTYVFIGAKVTVEDLFDIEVAKVAGACCGYVREVEETFCSRCGALLRRACSTYTPNNLGSKVGLWATDDADEVSDMMADPQKYGEVGVTEVSDYDGDLIGHFIGLPVLDSGDIGGGGEANKITGAAKARARVAAVIDRAFPIDMWLFTTIG